MAPIPAPARPGEGGAAAHPRNVRREARPLPTPRPPADGRDAVRRRFGAPIGCLLLAGLLGLGTVGGVRLCGEPLDISGSTDLPGWLSALKNRDELAYPAHAILGDLLDRAGCSPLASGLQWLKAGAHARTEREVAAVGDGLAAARARGDRPEAFDAALCRFVGSGFARPQQEAATWQAGITCR